MSLGLWIRKSLGAIGFKIAVGYSVLFALSFVALTAFAYVLLDKAVERRDREMIETEVQSLQGQYQKDGWRAFNNQVNENDRFRRNNPFFTRIILTPNQDGLVFFPHYWKEFDLKHLDKVPLPAPGTWFELDNREGTCALEIFTARHFDGSLFQVGISSEERLSVLNRFRETFLIVSIPLILLAGGGGALLSRRVLRPVRNLIVAAASIESGKLDARVPQTHAGDELDELGELFNRMIEKINQLIRGMRNSLDSVAHDLRTPMTRFRNKAEAALQNGSCMNDYGEALQECVEESDRILRTLNMLMDISEAETGTMRLKLKRVDLVQLATEIVEMYRFVAEGKGIHIETVFPAAAQVEADADRICQVLANLLDNAVKFTPDNGTVSVRIDTFADHVSLHVADTGIGIEHGEIHRIWDRLYRGTHPTHKGIGLGLSLVRAVVHAHQGEISASSTPGTGSDFEIVLPAIRKDRSRSDM